MKKKVALSIVADDEDQVALQLLALLRELAYVNAAEPVVWNRESGRRFPLAFTQADVAHRRVGLW